MEDLSIRAIVIGVSLFVTVLTLSTIVLYFNTARGIADTVSDRTDIAESYDDIMNTDKVETIITGVEVRSLINKYIWNSDVEINIVSISGTDTNQYVNINNKFIQDDGWVKQINNNSYLISEEKLNLINPVWNCKVDKEIQTLTDEITFEVTKKTILNIRLDVKE